MAATIGAFALVGSIVAPTSATAAPTNSQPNAAAQAAGVEHGNAPMGWRDGVGGNAAGTVRSESAGGGDAMLHSWAKITRPSKLTPMSGVLGIDVSSYQGAVDWVAFAKVNRKFAYVKATEGSSYRNPYFASQFGGAKAAGMYAGAYHFANPGGKSGKTQAKYFVKYGGALATDGKTLPGVLDIEYNPYGGGTCYGKSKKKMRAWIKSFTKEYKKLTNRNVVIYSTGDWWSRCTGNTKKFSKSNPLWLARWTPKSGAGTMPGGWTNYTFWQYASGSIDQNRFSGSLVALKAFAVPVPPV